MIRICAISAKLPQLEDIFALPTAFETLSDFQNQPLGFAAKFWLATDSTHFYFAAKVNSAADFEPHASGSFVEGLWERDVVEVFFREENSSRYQEFNLSPAGAWWTQTFSKYRAREAASAAGPSNAMAKSSEDYWQAAVSIPFAAIKIKFIPGKPPAVHLAAIIGKQPRRYISSQHPAAASADFHQDGCFQSAVILPQ